MVCLSSGCESADGKHEVKLQSNSTFILIVRTGIFLFDMIFLGTSASAPSAWRGLSAQMVLHDEYRFLIDCGEGT
jgi:hypothetical protein